MNLGPSKMGVSGCCAYESVPVMDFDYIKVHHSQLAQPGCGETYKDVKPDTTSPDHQDFPPDEISLTRFAPSTQGSGLASSGWWRWLDGVVPRDSELVADDPDVRAVSAVNRSSDSGVPVAS